MFQDWEGIPPQFASESSVEWAFVEGYRRAEEEGRAAAYFAWAEYTGESDYDAYARDLFSSGLVFVDGYVFQN